MPSRGEKLNKFSGVKVTFYITHTVQCKLDQKDLLPHWFHSYNPY